MLQKRSFDDQPFGEAAAKPLAPADLLAALQRRWLYLVVPFALVFVIGATVVALWPAVYRAEGKILVESQQIPTDLVRPTVSSAASERIQVIEQRIMTRDNLLAIAKKYGISAGWRQRFSGTELVDFMRNRTEIKPVELKIPVRPNARQTIAFAVGFDYEQPAVAMRVANELVTMILNEDVKTRTNFAVETTRFLERQAQKLEGDLNAVEIKIADQKRREMLGLPRKDVSPGEAQLAALKAELVQKSSIYSDSHPDIKALKARIAALEKTIVPMIKNTEPELGIDALERQQDSLQKDLETTNQKLSAARMGESLERGQQSERLEVLEQPTLPQEPISPKRPKLLAVVFALATMAGGGLVFLVEHLDGTIRRSADVAKLIDGDLLVTIPYISTSAELARQRKKRWITIVALVAVLLLILVLAAMVLPLDDLLTRVMARFST